MSETDESYEIDILSGSTVLRTLSSSTAGVTYAAADIAADFGSTPSSLAIEVYQLSSTTGRGSPASATLYF